jgi:hypothetical protein
VERYLDHVRIQVTNLFEASRGQPPPPRVLPFDWIGAIKSFKSLSDDIVVKGADKNLGVCVMSREFYNNQLSIHLHDCTSYTQVPVSDYMQIHKNLLSEILRLIQHAFYTLPEKEYNYLIQGFDNSQATDPIATLPKLYVIPKLHKDPITTRPIIPSLCYPTTPLSKLCSKYLKGGQAKLAQCILNSKQFVQRVENQTVSEHALLVTMDVDALFTNVNVQQAIEPCVAHLIGPIQDTIRQALSIVLSNTFFRCDTKIFKQTYGGPMGTSCMPKVADIWLGAKEASIALLPDLYTRFLDDIFFIVDGDENKVIAFQQALEATNPRIKLKRKISLISADFLDITVFKHKITNEATNTHSFILKVRPFQKPFNTYGYLWPYSNHPPHTFKAWIVQELKRYILNSSDEADFVALSRLFMDRLLQRGYDGSLLKTWFGMASYSMRHTLLAPAHAFGPPPPPTSREATNLIIPYNQSPFTAKIGGVLRMVHSTLSNSQTAHQDVWTIPTPRVAFSVHNTVGRHVSHNRHAWNPHPLHN